MRILLLIITVACVSNLGVSSPAADPLPPGGSPAQVAVNSQPSLKEALGVSFAAAIWENPTTIVPSPFPGFNYVSGPNDPLLSPKSAWRKPLVLSDAKSGVEITIQSYRRQESRPAAGASATPAATAFEADYEYSPAKFRGFKAARASSGEFDILAVRNGDLLVKIEAAGAKGAARRRSIDIAAEAIEKLLPKQ